MTFAVLALSSCEGLLNTTPEDGIGSLEMWTTAEHADFNGGRAGHVVLEVALREVEYAAGAGDDEADEAPPCQRQMDVEDLLGEAHDLFFRRIDKDQPLAEGKGQATEYGNKGDAGTSHQSSPL